MPESMNQKHGQALRKWQLPADLFQINEKDQQ